MEIFKIFTFNYIMKLKTIFMYKYLNTCNLILLINL